MIWHGQVQGQRYYQRSGIVAWFILGTIDNASAQGHARFAERSISGDADCLPTITFGPRIQQPQAAEYYKCPFITLQTAFQVSSSESQTHSPPPASSLSYQAVHIHYLDHAFVSCPYCFPQTASLRPPALYHS